MDCALFKWKPAKAGCTTVHEASYHQLKLGGKQASADSLAQFHIFIGTTRMSKRGRLLYDGRFAVMLKHNLPLHGFGFRAAHVLPLRRTLGNACCKRAS